MGVRETVPAAHAQVISKNVTTAARQLASAGLTDELHLHMAPVLLGEGRHLFERGADAV